MSFAEEDNSYIIITANYLWNAISATANCQPASSFLYMVFRLYMQGR